ncbi:MAG: cell division protein FtsW [Rhodospirillales bacterium]|nr:cell division protein FtsW [Rhodospirillales bacterium]
MLFSRTDTSLLGQWWWTVDRKLLAALLGLMGFGIVLVTSSGPAVAERIGYGQYHFIERHLIVLGPALALMIGLSFLPPVWVRRASVLVLAGCLVAMAGILVFGTEVKGAQRWFSLMGFSLQPSEFVKPSLAIVTAWLIARQKEIPDFPAHKICAGLFATVVTLLLLQPDLGMTVVVTAVIVAQIFLAGLPFRYLFVFGLGGAGLIGASYLLFSHVRSRIDRFLYPESGDTYQIDQAMDAFHNGGFFGMGPGQGTVKLSIPDAHSDFIFAVAAEEFGVIFLIPLIALFAFIVLRGLNRSTTSGDLFVLLAGGGLSFMFGLQALIHAGSNAHLLPTKGMTLPFVSYGGSSFLAMAYGMGSLLALTRRQVRDAVSRGGLALARMGP